MKIQSSRLKEREEGLELFHELVKEKYKTLIIHYSCESFVNTKGRTPRITSICICDRKSYQMLSFSIHLQAQFDKKDYNNLSEQQYDGLERKMLEEFYKFVSDHKTHRWIHWHMRDSNYGFEAIQNRSRILGVPNIETIENDFKYDLAIILKKIYSNNYEIDVPDGKLLNLAKRNKIDTRDVLTGKEEANAFEEKEYLQLHRSTLKKVYIISKIIERIEKNSLKVSAKKSQIYGTNITGLIQIIKNTWWIAIIWAIIIFILGAAAEPLIQKLFRINH